MPLAPSILIRNMTTRRSEAGNGRDGSSGHFRLVPGPATKTEDLSVAERVLTEGLRELIREGRAQLVGPVRQELLSGVARRIGLSKIARLSSSVRRSSVGGRGLRGSCAHEQCMPVSRRRWLAGGLSNLCRCSSSKLANFHYRPRLYSLPKDSPAQPLCVEDVT